MGYTFIGKGRSKEFGLNDALTEVICQILAINNNGVKSAQVLNHAIVPTKEMILNEVVKENVTLSTMYFIELLKKPFGRKFDGKLSMDFEKFENTGSADSKGEFTISLTVIYISLIFTQQQQTLI